MKIEIGENLAVVLVAVAAFGAMVALAWRKW